MKIKLHPQKKFKKRQYFDYTYSKFTFFKGINIDFKSFSLILCTFNK